MIRHPSEAPGGPPANPLAAPPETSPAPRPTEPAAAAPRVLLAIPVYNEQHHVTHVLEKVQRYLDDVLVIDDGSTDQTPMLLARQTVEVIRHARNRGYGQSLIDAFRWAQCYRFDWLITMDCDEQHEPESLPDFLDAIQADRFDLISGTRYQANPTQEDAIRDDAQGAPPPERRAVNGRITAGLNRRLDLKLTDAFCGFKAYRVDRLSDLRMSETGYAFPMQFWVQAAAAGWRIGELPIKLIYNDPNRSFGGQLDDADHRLKHYLDVMHAELHRHPRLTAAAPGNAAADSPDSGPAGRDACEPACRRSS